MTVSQRTLWMAGLIFAQAAALPGEGRDPVVYMIEGTKTGQVLGKSLAALGDLDGDGVIDFAASQSLFTDDQAPGQVNLYSGKDGKLLRSIRGVGDYDYLGSGGLSAVPDLDGDGIPELYASAGGTGFAVISPVTGERWYLIKKYVSSGTHRGPKAPLWPIEDLDGDGIQEFVGATPGFDTEASEYIGVVTAFSSRTGAVIWERFGSEAQSQLGLGFLAVSDFNADGITDFLASEDIPSAQGPANDERFSHIRVLSGRNGETLRTYEAPGPTYYKFGWQMASLGDRDGDHYPEVAVAAPDYIEPASVDGKNDDGQHRGWVGVYKLPDFELLFSHEGRDTRFLAFNGDRLGSSLLSPGDLDRDGINDLLMGTDRYSNDPFRSGRLYIMSGATGELLTTYEATQGSSTFFEVMVSLGDLDGEGLPEFLVGAPVSNVPSPGGPGQEVNAGRIFALRLEASGPVFLRGDANEDGKVNIADVVAIARYSLERTCAQQGESDPQGPSCPAAYDVDGDGCIRIDDALGLVRHLFVLAYYWQSPYPPYPDCGRTSRVWGDIYRDLGCAAHDACRTP